MDIPKKAYREAIKIVEHYGCWNYSVIQRLMRIPYHKAKAINKRLREMGVIDDRLILITTAKGNNAANK